ncbi:hypothetical protein BVER_02217c [Candidatus Burkholderia verschuerenii]|uniref:Stability determinant domain-containing protein n=1 Tax=Candidatus Burkholderia verschuerenii TaxID=242163 RepID=A0A0L0MI82_9BURK|nr:hypothetical protein [Candidatus Burkholderia verschuerenii]KND62000.1 hypothetical protein BVER_02217c [Candidatus Burkholderia verschuerenii]
MTTPLDPIVSEFATVEDAEAYEAWYRAKIQDARDRPGPLIAHDEAMARIRGKLQAKLKEQERKQA